MAWLGIAAVGVALALFIAWRVLVANQSVATLDRIDSLFTGRIAAQRITYGSEPGQVLYVYGQRPAKPLPVLVWVHGGSWKSGDPKDYAFIARNLALDGFLVVNAGYRLGKPGRFPAMVEDTAAAVAWVHAHIADYGGDPGRICLMGHSAGAYNVAMVALDREWLGREGLSTDIIKGVVGLAGPYDFYPFDTPSSKSAFGDAPRPQRTQPIAFARADAPPMLLVNGRTDETVRPRNAVALARALSQAGKPTDPVLLDGVGHVGILLGLAEPFDRWSGVKQRVLPFLAQCAKGGETSAPVKPQNR